MKTYEIQVSIVTYHYVLVEASSEEEAVSKAWKDIDNIEQDEPADFYTEIKSIGTIESTLAE